VTRERTTKPWLILFVLGLVLIVSSMLGPMMDGIRDRSSNQIVLGDYSPAIEYVQETTEDLLKKQSVPSVVVALLDGEDVLYAQPFGYSNVEEEVPASLDTIYQMGSITKLFTAIEIMRLVENGLVDLDAPITEYLPRFSIQQLTPSDPITIRSLLAHRSGLPRNDNLVSWYWDAQPDILKAQVDSLAKSYQAYPAGQRYKYSNVGYELLGRIIEVKRGIQTPAAEAVSGWPYYMKDHMLSPMGMQDTSFGSSRLLYGKEPANSVAMGYGVYDGKSVPVNQYDIIHLASGNLWSTMNDQIRFAQMILNPENLEAAGILSVDSVNTMFEPQYVRERDPQPNGLGWFTESELFGEQIVIHTGIGQGFQAVIMLIPKQKLGFIAMSNSYAFEEFQIPMAIRTLELMLEAKTGVAITEKEELEAIELDSSILEKYTGKYVIRNEMIEIISDGGRLEAVYQDRKVKMAPIADNKFYLTSWLADVEDITLEFWIDDLEEEDLMIVTMGDYFLCPKYSEVKDAPPIWRALKGRYELYAQTPSVYSEDELLGTVEILIQDGVLKTSDGKMLLPVDDSLIRIVGGIFDGEIMEYDEISGELIWQGFIFRPIE